jgi:hypothetical protein
VDFEGEDPAFAEAPKMVKKQSNVFEALKNNKNKCNYISFEKNKKPS